MTQEEVVGGRLTQDEVVLTQFSVSLVERKAKRARFGMYASAGRA